MNKSNDESVGTKIMCQITKHRESKKGKYPEYENKYKDKSLEELIKAYKNDSSLDKKEKDWLYDEIYCQFFFLFPYAIKQHCYILNSDMFDETMQNLSLKFLDALRLYNPDSGYPFSHYFTGYLYAAVRKTFRESNLIKLPNKKKKRCVIQEIPLGGEGVGEDEEIPVGVDKLMKNHGMEEMKEEEASSTDIQTDRTFSCTALESIDNFGGEERVKADEALYRKEVKEWLEEALSEENGLLSKDERMVIILHNGLFGNDSLIYRKIAELKKKKDGKNCTRARISQIHQKAIDKLRRWFEKYEVFGRGQEATQNIPLN